MVRIALNKNAVDLAKSIIDSMGDKLKEEFKIVESDFTWEVNPVDLPETTCDYA